MSNEQTTPAEGFSYRLTRTLDAPAAQVWRAPRSATCPSRAAPCSSTA
ncbi:hypothetical protein [Streptomyces sp. VMFN-G11Ma]|nr:hypothetical protein [Streptomyces sp. VMFN-G11Ma]PTM92351.1 hypothetical protein C7821_109172 [Streptomyces sp. VMFN-G11Ma]